MPAGWIEQQSPRFFTFVRAVAGLFLRVYIRRYRATGMEHVPATGGVFVIANHTSAMDPFFLCYPIRRKNVRGPGKVELFKGRFASWVLYKVGIFPLKQGGADAAAVRTMVELYRRGECVCIFPEGGRSDFGDLQPFLPEFARLAIKLKATIVPAGIAGAFDVMPVGATWPRRNVPVRVIFGEAFQLSQYYGGRPSPEAVQEASDLLRSRVAELIAQAEAERALM